jgi:hypothetical protein
MMLSDNIMFSYNIINFRFPFYFTQHYYKDKIDFHLETANTVESAIDYTYFI